MPGGDRGLCQLYARMWSHGLLPGAISQPPWGPREEAAIRQPRTEAAGGISPADTVMLDLQLPELREDPFLSFRRCSVGAFRTPTALGEVWEQFEKVGIYSGVSASEALTP